MGQIGSTDATGFQTDPRNMEGFLMVYHDPYGGVWRTDEIVAGGSGDVDADAAAGLLEDVIAASRVQDALRALPNEVLEGVSVKARTSNTVEMCTPLLRWCPAPWRLLRDHRRQLQELQDDHQLLPDHLHSPQRCRQQARLHH